MSKGQQEKALDDAVFAAGKGKVRGPVKTQFGFYIFEVTKVTPASQQTLAQATPAIKQQLASQNQQKALDAFVKDFRKEWTGKTSCRDGFKTQECKNAPKVKTDTTGGAQQVPQGAGGAQQVPPGAGGAQQVPPGAGGAQQVPRGRGWRAAGAPGRRRRCAAGAAAGAPRPVSDEVEAAVGRLDLLTRRLRRECPWDREQTALTIVPHTVEEAYELADAARSGDDARLRDELGDVLFQVHFLSLLLEERGAGSLADVAEHCRQKLIRRHPPRLLRHRGLGRRRRAAQLGRDQARRGRPRARPLRRGPREPARPAAGAQGSAPRGVQRL